MGLDQLTEEFTLGQQRVHFGALKELLHVQVKCLDTVKSRNCVGFD